MRSATVGKLGRAEDHRTPMKAGVGSASITLPSGLIVSAIVAVNAVGDIIDPASGKVVAAAFVIPTGRWPTRAMLRGGAAIAAPRAGGNTTIAVVATNARLTKTQAGAAGADGRRRCSRAAIAPSHTQGDGDTVFGSSHGDVGWRRGNDDDRRARRRRCSPEANRFAPPRRADGLGSPAVTSGVRQVDWKYSGFGVQSSLLSASFILWLLRRGIFDRALTRDQGRLSARPVRGSAINHCRQVAGLECAASPSADGARVEHRR